MPHNWTHTQNNFLNVVSEERKKGFFFFFKSLKSADKNDNHYSELQPIRKHQNCLSCFSYLGSIIISLLSHLFITVAREVTPNLCPCIFSRGGFNIKGCLKWGLKFILQNHIANFSVCRDRIKYLPKLKL